MANDLKNYDIRISEAHRQYLLTAVQNMIDQNYLGADPSEREEIELLHGMLDDATGVDPFFDPVMNDFTL